MWTCSACNRPIYDCDHGILIADDLGPGQYVNWRVVHHITCDPDTGPWHILEQFIGRNGLRNFKALQKIGAFSALTPAQIDEVQGLVVRPNYKYNEIERTSFSGWIVREYKRRDAIGDLLRHIIADYFPQVKDANLTKLYERLQENNESPTTLALLVDTYREWQSYGNVPRELIRPSKPATPTKQERPSIDKRSAFRPVELRDGWLALRFRILKRDGYRCQMCGRNAKDHGAILEVDHIVPRAKGGTDDPTNLWTLCFDCNRGKRDSDL